MRKKEQKRRSGADLGEKVSLHNTKLSTIMDMKKVTCAVLLVATAYMSAALATTEVPAPAPGPSSGASATVVGSLVGASIMSFFALFH
ncbi:hypothetical protein RJT34_23914 [Clitoria ternatea]|uniref:Arabinogalactan peptide 23-like n=1 Tax=Clitoria ternatea TaxID=43366 RepID=A0AAN9IIU1_CLITE